MAAFIRSPRKIGVFVPKNNTADDQVRKTSPTSPKRETSSSLPTTGRKAEHLETTITESTSPTDPMEGVEEERPSTSLPVPGMTQDTMPDIPAAPEADMTGGDQDDQDDPEIRVVEIPNGWSTSKYVLEGKKQIVFTLVKFKGSNGHPDFSKEGTKNSFEFVKSFLVWLEFFFDDMTPDLKNYCKIDQALQFMSDPVYKMPEYFQETAKRIYKKFEEENWGATNADSQDMPEQGDEISDDDAPRPPAAKPAAKPKKTAGDDKGDGNAVLGSVAEVKPVPPSHPIWGTKGIMHGLALKKGTTRKVVLYNPAYRREKKKFRVYGHNNIRPGTWWPRQLAAVFNGAHGSAMGGITGDSVLGAISIVVSGAGPYAELDKDKGDVLYYSGDQSHDNKDKEKVLMRSLATESLVKSIKTNKQVRVLRKGGEFGPDVGLRYDGLYRVTSMYERKNTHGGLYEQFRLERCKDADQPSLEECRKFPTQAQRADFAKIKDGY